MYSVAPDGSGLHEIVANFDCCLLVSPDGMHLSMAGSAQRGGHISTQIVKADGTDPALLALPNEHINLGPGAWVSNTEIAFEGWDDNDPTRNGLYLGPITAKGPPPQRITAPPDGGHDLPIAASPLGDRILFLRVGPDPGVPGSLMEDGDLYVANLDGSNQQKVNPSGTLVSGKGEWGAVASWSPDGHSFTFPAFIGDPQAENTIYVADADGNGLTPIARSMDFSTSAHWSPAGDWIAFDQNAHASIAHPDGTAAREVGALNTCCGLWSPDGSQVMYQTLTGYRIGNVDGSGDAALTNDPGWYLWPGWSPIPIR